MSKNAKAVLLLSALLVATTARGEGDGSFFFKLPLTSFHLGNAGGYKFNQQNFGVGIGYRHTQDIPGVDDVEIAYSLAQFVDSYRCEATNLQVRALKKVGTIALGTSLNLAHKCVRPYTGPKTFVAPLLTSAWSPSKSVKIVLDGFPPISRKYGVGFICVSLDIDF